jgi:hypothetical protein
MNGVYLEIVNLIRFDFKKVSTGLYVSHLNVN